MEIGPFRVQGDKLVENEGSWHEFANLLFGIDPKICELTFQLINLSERDLVMLIRIVIFMNFLRYIH